jgi:aflatoxin B1 aldehyde reductase
MKIILGTMNIEYPWTSNNNKSIEGYKEIIDYYINWSISKKNKPILDTAYYYGGSKTEYVLGQIIPQLGSIPSIATKANPWYQNDFTNGKFGQLSKENLTYQLDVSLSNLNLKQVDIFYLHCWDWETPIKETLEVSTDLWRREKFNKFGISNFSLNQINEVIQLTESEGYCPLSYYQGMYNMIARKIEETFPILNTSKIEFWAYNPLAGGLLTGKYAQIYNSKSIGESNIPDSRFKSNKIYQNIFWKEPILNGIEDFVNLPNPTTYALNWYSQDSKLNDSDGVILGSSSLEQIKTNLNLLDSINSTQLDKSIYTNFYNKYLEFEKDTPDYFY